MNSFGKRHPSGTQSRTLYKAFPRHASLQWNTSVLHKMWLDAEVSDMENKLCYKSQITRWCTPLFRALELLPESWREQDCQFRLTMIRKAFLVPIFVTTDCAERCSSFHSGRMLRTPPQLRPSQELWIRYVWSNADPSKSHPRKPDARL